MNENDRFVENTCFYEIYNDTKGEDATLEDLCDRCLKISKKYTDGYIWQVDEFKLRPTSARKRPWIKQESESACLWGATRFEDNIEDEWFITWILLDITRKLPVVARIWDSDGDIILIEAAYCVPQWLRPENSANRLWIKKGMVHLIQSDEDTTEIHICEALQTVLDSDTVKPSPQIQAALMSRIAGYPKKALSNMHRSSAILPVKLAAVLQQYPTLIAPSVCTLYYRDLDDVKAGRGHTYIPYDTEQVETVIKFNKCLYAQIVSQEVEVPMDYPLPLPHEKSYSSALLGLKVVKAFEMLACRIATEGKFGTQPEWCKFLKGLKDKSYFNKEIEGSESYKQLLKEAKNTFEKQLSEKIGDDISYNKFKLLDILTTVKEFEFDRTKIEEPDSDDWYQELKNIEFSEAYDKDQNNEEWFDLKNELADKFEEFINDDDDNDNDNDKADHVLNDDNADHVHVDDDNIIKKEDIKMNPLMALNINPTDMVQPYEYNSDEFWNELDDFAAGAQFRERNVSQIVGDKMSEPDSDDESSCSSDYFQKAYEDAIRTEITSNPNDTKILQNEGTLGSEVAPLELDFNVVENLLASYGAQEGLPGPVGNFAGMFGVDLEKNNKQM